MLRFVIPRVVSIIAQAANGIVYRFDTSMTRFIVSPPLFNLESTVRILAEAGFAYCDARRERRCRAMS